MCALLMLLLLLKVYVCILSLAVCCSFLFLAVVMRVVREGGREGRTGVETLEGGGVEGGVDTAAPLFCWVKP